MKPVIYHGTPLTPRAALTGICAGRAMCVSFYRPDDVEVVEAISPDVMFRQWRILVLAGGASARRGLERDRGLAAILRLARAAPFHAGTVGNHAGYPRCAVPAQRQHLGRVAVRAEGCARVAHGWPDRSAVAAVRAARPGLPWVDRAESWIAGLPRQDGRGGQGARQSLAGPAHASRRQGSTRLPFLERRQHIAGAEWTSI